MRIQGCSRRSSLLAGNWPRSRLVAVVVVGRREARSPLLFLAQRNSTARGACEQHPQISNPARTPRSACTFALAAGPSIRYRRLRSDLLLSFLAARPWPGRCLLPWRAVLWQQQQPHPHQQAAVVVSALPARRRGAISREQRAEGGSECCGAKP